MKKYSKSIVIILVVVIIISAGMGIFLYNKEQIKNEEKVQEQKTEIDTIEEFKNKLKDTGVMVDLETENTECDLIGASKGVSYMISDSLIQIYKFDENSTNELTVSNLKLAKEEGKVIMPSVNDTEINVIYNKGLILVNVEDNPEKDKIIEAFKSL